MKLYQYKCKTICVVFVSKIYFYYCNLCNYEGQYISQRHERIKSVNLKAIKAMINLPCQMQEGLLINTFTSWRLYLEEK